MAVSQARFVEKIIDHPDDANTEQRLSSHFKDAEKYVDPPGKKTKALFWIFYEG